MRKGDKRLKYEDRKEIEKMKNDGVRVVVIAEKIGVHRATIQNELKRGGTPYRAEVAQKTIQGEYEESRNRRKSQRVGGYGRFCGPRRAL